MIKEAITLLEGLDKGLKSTITLYFGKKDLDEYSTIQGEYNNPFDIEESMNFYQFRADLSIIWRKGELVTNSMSINDIINILLNKKLGELRPDDFFGLMRGDCDYPELYENELIWKFNEEEDDGPEEYDLESLLNQSSIEYINQTFDFTGVQRFTILVGNNALIEIVDELEE